MGLNLSREMINSKKWESMTYEEVLKYLESSESGLTKEEALKRLEVFGENKLPEGKKESKIVKFLKQFNNALIYILIGAALLTAVLGHWLDTWVILGVVIINSIIGYIQEEKAKKALEKIKHLLSLKSTVIRDSNRSEIAAEELVVGDIVFLSTGDKIPADIRLTEVNNLRVEEASLTGESEAVSKKTSAVAEGTLLGDRKSMVYTGTTIRQGSAKGIVVATGTDTELGKINKMLSETKSVETPLIRKINKFGKDLSIGIIGFATLVLLFGFFVRRMPLDETALAVIGLAVAAIPEGLPAIMTVTLAIGVQKMAKRNAIIRNLPSVETLGSVTVICSDKTGTLTKNEMTATAVYTKSGRYDITGSGYDPTGEILENGNPVSVEEIPLLKKMMQSAFLCNDANLSKEKDFWKVEGSPTEGALLALARKSDINFDDTERIYTIPFDSSYKYMATLNRVGSEKLIFVNGAPERLLEKCSYQLEKSGETSPLDINFWNDKIEEGASSGKRMLAMAYKPAGEMTSIEHDDMKNELTFIGLAGLIDPPRPEAIEAVKQARIAGIKIKMITGDHALTAKMIGKSMGIGDGVKSLTGADLDEMDDNRLREAVMDCDIFARTSPDNKLKLVKALQENGEICAMTGDGVNDAPALKKADIGIAMGIKGTEVTKESGSMVLADDNFASIISAVEEGRTIYDNLRKTLLFLLPANGAESFVILAAIALGVLLPVTPVQILWINMISAITMALSLAFEPVERKTMELPPRDPKKSILGGYFLFRILLVSLLIGVSALSLFLVLVNSGNYNVNLARTIAVNTIVFGELFYLFNCRRLREPTLGRNFFKNKVTFISVGVMIILQMLLTYMPFMNTLFETEPLDIKHWMFIISIAFGIFIVIEIEKIITGKITGKNK